MNSKHNTILENIRMVDLINNASREAVDLHRPYLEIYYLFSDVYDVHAMVAFRITSIVRTSTFHIWLDPPEFELSHSQLVDLLFTRIQERVQQAGFLEHGKVKCINDLQTLVNKLKS